MNAHRTDSFEEWWELKIKAGWTGQPSILNEPKDFAKAGYKAGQKDAEKKIEEADVYEANKEIELLKEDTEELKRGTIIGLNLHAEELKRSSELRKKIEILTKALEYYENEKSWISRGYGHAPIDQIRLDNSKLMPSDPLAFGNKYDCGGKRARKALAEIKELK